MPLCKRCGKEISENLKICPLCGAKVNYKSKGDDEDIYGGDFDLDADLELEDLDDEDYDEDKEDDDGYYNDFADLEDEDDN